MKNNVLIKALKLLKGKRLQRSRVELCCTFKEIFGVGKGD